MKPTAILTGDWHLREDTPKCRTDNFWEAQWKKVKFIKELADEYSCPILHSGDLFHHWKPSPRLISFCIECLPFIYVIPGNHDLPNHNLDLLEKSGLWTLQKAGKIAITKIKLGEIGPGQYETAPVVGMIHKLINHPQSDTTAKGLLKKHKDYDLILTGDNHESFNYSDGKRILINPGSLMRQTAAQEEHTPKVYLWFAEDNSYQVQFLPQEKDVISRDHLEKVEERDERMEAFIARLDSDYETELSFENNIKLFLKKNPVSKSEENLIWESIEEEV